MSTDLRHLPNLRNLRRATWRVISVICGSQLGEQIEKKLFLSLFNNSRWRYGESSSGVSCLARPAHLTRLPSWCAHPPDSSSCQPCRAALLVCPARPACPPSLYNICLSARLSARLPVGLGFGSKLPSISYAHRVAYPVRFDLFQLQIIHKVAHLAECQHVKPCLSFHLTHFVHVLFTFRPVFLLFPLCRHAFAM